MRSRKPFRKNRFSGNERPHQTAPKTSQKSQRSGPSIQQLEQRLCEAAIHLNPEQINQLWTYHNLLRARNEDRELTRIINFEAVVVKHYIDCLIVGDLWEIPGPLMDLGSGAGFPGIPLKIRYPHLHIILAEPRPKRIAFLNEVITTLGLKNIEVFEHKVVSRSFTTPVSAVISRAVEEIPKTLLRTLGACRPGSQVIFMKGPNCKDEILEARKRPGDLYQLKWEKNYTLPKTQFERKLIVYERTDKPIASPAKENSDL